MISQQSFDNVNNDNDIDQLRLISSQIVQPLPPKQSLKTNDLNYNYIDDDDNQQLLSSASKTRQEISIEDDSSENDQHRLLPSQIPATNLTKQTQASNPTKKISTNKQCELISSPSTINPNKDDANNQSLAEDNSFQTTKTTTSHRSFSFSRLIRFFSFGRRKKFKILETKIDSSEQKSNLRGRQSHSSLPFIKRKRKNSKKKVAKDDSEIKNDSKDMEDTPFQGSTYTDHHPNVFTRFVRTFSFLYKRQENSQLSNNLKRSTSLNPGKTKSSEIKKHSKRNRTKSDSDNISAISSPSRRSEPTINTNQRSKFPKPTVPNGDIFLSNNNNSHKSVQCQQIISQEKKESIKIRKEHFDHLDAQLKPSVVNNQKNLENSSDFGDNNQNGNLQNKNQHSVACGLETPAVCGIQNHGNTCFINSIIQCLSNTNPFAEYFVMDYFREDLAQNKSFSKKSANRGELIEHLALLLKSLWSCMYSSDISLKFKKICSKYAPQYVGYEQHDAQEFLLWLLDKSHEELGISNPKVNKNFVSMLKNNVSSNHKKTSEIKTKIPTEKSDETAAVEFLAKCQTIDTNSIIYDLFQGQLRSMIVCPNCRHCSKTFDPYMCISLPVPIRLKFTIFIQAIVKENHSTIMYGISIEAAATLRELRDKISRMIKVPERRLLLLQLDNRHGIVEFANDYEMIQQIFEDCETIYALETPKLPEDNNNVEMCRQILTLVWVNRVGIDRYGTIFGPLFTTTVSRELNYKKLQATILSEMAPYIVEHEKIDFFKLSQAINLRLRVLNGLNTKEYLKSDVDHPLFIRTVECALAKTEDRRSYRGPYHLKLVIEWDLDVRQSILVSDEQFDAIAGKNGAFVDKSVELAKECSKMNNHTTLQDCLDMYFRDESLTVENAWWCPSCDSRQQCVKQLSIWSLPDILIIHLKRFRYISDLRRIKVNTMIQYPQNGLDLLKYIQKKFDSNGDMINSSNKMSLSASNKLSYKKMGQNLEETTYNLYAVCCHHGTMQGGHYTAYCKNSIDNCWYLFDDTKVMPMFEEDVVTPNAYILFYQKSYVSFAYSEKTIRTNNSTNFSNNSERQHWSTWMPLFNYQNSKSSTLPNRKLLTKNSYSVNHNSSNVNHIGPLFNNILNHNYISQGPKTLNETNLKKYPQEDYNQYNGYHNDNDYNNHRRTNNDVQGDSNHYQLINTFPRNKSKYSY